MLLRAFVASLHFLALGIGLGAVFVRGLRLRDLGRAPADAAPLPGLFAADSLWGLAAALSDRHRPAARLRGPGEGDRVLPAQRLLLREAGPVRGRVRAGDHADAHVPRLAARAPTGATPWATAPIGRLARLNDIELALVVLIPFAAALMARGAWLF